MELDENTYVLGYWFASDGQNNWYLMMTKQNGKWIGEHTFRYNKDDGDPFLDADKKSRYTFNLDGAVPEEEVIDKIELLFTVIKHKFDDFNDSFLIQGSADKFISIAKTKDYLHLKMEH